MKHAFFFSNYRIIGVNKIDHNLFFYFQRVDTFLDEYHQLLTEPQYSQYSDLGIVGVPYDAIWSIALALDMASEKIATGNESGCDNQAGDLVPLEEFDYSNEKVGCIMKQSLDEIEFTGVTVSNNNYYYYCIH